ncbi:glycosyltransferase [Photobacterium damselae subsp. damselae]|uniref:glycosyltransferase n=1 Tax=Photobacterium damselae TaxID=38293 RepID=UPI0015935EF7|nr:glycosyltransferase [Photobacterium damselae]NVH52663.1 glycosyltransferase [Photobacterium damselae subsp. damselae]NVO81657.1 glycosyltransferase [Photobacterium damselae subsp. damselae]
MKRIVFYLPSLAPAGGIERVVTSIINNLCDSFEITILTKDSEDSFYTINSKIKHDNLNSYISLDMKSKVRRFFSQLKMVYSSSIRLSKYLKENNFDYIYVTHPISHFELLLAGVNSNNIIISEHGASNNYNSVYRLIRKLTYKKCKYYCVPTKYDCEYYNKLGFPVIYTPHYRPDLNYQQADLDSKIVLNIGRFTDDKKQLRLLKIWNEIDSSIRSGWILKIVGYGELLNDLENFIKDNKLSESVFLLKPRKDIEFFYKNAAIFALSSRSEGFGMVLLEAAGFGLPLISFNCPSGPRDIINNNNGFLIENDSDELYRKNLIRMMEDRNMLETLSQGSKQLCLDWSNEKINEIWMKIFK